MRQVYKAIRRVAAHDFPVIITGESGTGKELVARAIHQHSDRAGRP
jgi:two-component system nitrogen regulation response regulator GlnG